jgi:hypothetical protein
MTEAFAAPPREDAIFALYDGDYYLGLGALVNSAYRAGFRGIAYVGYRGSLPPWASRATATDGYADYPVANGCAIRFIEVDYAGHLTNHKPTFMLSIIERHCPDAQRLFYFDVDIVIKCRWPFFRDWAACGIAVCRDVNEPDMPANHPLRAHWRELAASCGFRTRPSEGYFNGGFVGIAAERSSFLKTWRALIQHVERSGVSLENFHFKDRTNPLMAMDQDLLNVAVMASDAPVSPMDASAMDITHGGYVMSHALFSVKPWRRRYLLDALRGYPPATADKLYWQSVTTPIAVASNWRRGAALLSLKTAAAIGRFYRRR